MLIPYGRALLPEICLELANYTHSSIVPNLAKPFEKPLFELISSILDQKFSKYQYVLRKGFNSRHCLASMLPKWIRNINKEKTFGALFTDLLTP